MPYQTGGWERGGFEPLGEERGWEIENPWQAMVSNAIVRLRECAQVALAAELAEMLTGLSERYDRAS